MIKTEFLMRSATWHNFNVNLLNCGMNIQIQKIQDKSSCWHKNNNTSSILTKQLCLLKITWPKKAIPTKSYSLAMLYLHHTKYLDHAQPRWQAKQLFHTFDIFKTFSIFTQYMSVSHGYSTIGGIEWWLWRRQKGEDSLTSTRRINELWRCPSIDINVSE